MPRTNSAIRAAALRELELLERRGVLVDPERMTAAADWAEEAQPGSESKDRLDEDDDRRDRKTDPAVLARQIADFAFLDGRVSSDWSSVAWTGRIYARRPAIQQLPKLGPYRHAVRAPAGRSLVVADWDQAQLRLLAAGAQDQALLDALKGDPHQATGDLVGAGLSPSERRKLGKTLNFACLFWASPDRISKTAAANGIALSHGDARAFQKRFREAYPDLFRFQQDQASLIRYPTLLGDEVCVPEHRQYPQAVLVSLGQMAESDALRTVLAWAPSYLAPVKGEPVVLVHDEVVFEVDAKRPDLARQLVTALMDDALNFISDMAVSRTSSLVGDIWGR